MNRDRNNVNKKTDVGYEDSSFVKFDDICYKLKLEFERVCESVAPLSDSSSQFLLLSSGHEDMASMKNHSRMIQEEVDLLNRRWKIVEKMIEMNRSVAQKEIDFKRSKLEWLSTCMSSIDELETFQANWIDLKNRIDQGYESSDGLTTSANETDNDKKNVHFQSVGDFAPIIDMPFSIKPPRFADIAFKSIAAKEILGKTNSHFILNCLLDLLFSTEKSVETSISNEKTYIVAKPNECNKSSITTLNDNSFPEMAQCSGSSMDGSFINCGENQAALLANLTRIDYRISQPNFDESDTLKFSNSEDQNVLDAYLRQAEKKPIITDSQFSQFTKPAAPLLKYSTNIADGSNYMCPPKWPNFKGAHIWDKTGQYSGKKDRSLKTNENSAFKPVGRSKEQDEKSRGKLPTPLRNYHRRSLADRTVDVSYTVSTVRDSAEQQLQKNTRVESFTKSQYNSLSGTVKEQISLVELNSAVQALNEFLDDCDETTFIRKTLQNAVASCLNSKKAMFFINALSETSKLNRQ